MKIAINKCFGGFGISLQCAYHMALHGHVESKLELLNYEWGSYFEFLNDNDSYDHWYGYYINSDEQRNDPYLIEAIECLGSAASGYLSDVKITEIPDDVEWYINDYDGIESVHERHRCWR
jgi:hypothetical protein